LFVKFSVVQIFFPSTRNNSMAGNCTNLIVLSILSTALPALLVAITIIVGMLITGQMQGNHAMIILLVCIVASFLPALATWLFGSKLISDESMSSCAVSLFGNGKQQQQRARVRYSQSMAMPPPPPPPGAMMRMQEAPHPRDDDADIYQTGRSHRGGATHPSMAHMYDEPVGSDFMNAFD
jgi:hypothetical protein